MTVHNKFKPYIRRMRLSDYSMNGDIVVDIDLAHFEVLRKPAYVLVVHGIKGAVIMCEASKQLIKRRVEEKCKYTKTFKEWCSFMKQFNVQNRSMIRESAKNEFGKVRDD